MTTCATCGVSGQPDTACSCFSCGGGRAAVAGCEAWHARPAVALCCADLGVWLSGQGRPEEAAVQLTRARELFAELGALAWAAELDAQLAGARV